VVQTNTQFGDVLPEGRPVQAPWSVGHLPF